MRAFECARAPLVPDAAWAVARRAWPWTRACDDASGDDAVRGIVVGGREVTAVAPPADNALFTSAAARAQKCAAVAAAADDDADHMTLLSKAGLVASDDAIRRKYEMANARRNAPKQEVEWSAQFRKDQIDQDKKVFQALAGFLKGGGEM